MVKVVQIEVGGFDHNFSYLVLGLGDRSNCGILIDPTGNRDAIESKIKKHGARVVLQLFTHSHPDHIELFDYFKSLGIRSFMPKPARLGKKETLNEDGFKITVIHTPGHTRDGVCFLVGNDLFSGDTLFVRGIGTTAYGGDEKALNETLNFLATFDKNLILWPGHNYGGASSTLGEALANSHIKPGEKTLDLIRKKVLDYEKNSVKKNKF